MQIKKQLTGFACALLVAAMAFTVTDSKAGRYGRGNGQPSGVYAGISNLPLQDLSAVEEIGLLKMREEEKLARDVYRLLYGKWNNPVFQNISQSEERHMAAVKLILDRYDMEDPAVDSSVGVFTDPEMQQLFAGLTERGDLSQEEALHVGATIEDMDIHDLETQLQQTDNADIRRVYQNLAKGSRNHLRIFVYQLSLLGVEYEAQFLSAGEVSKIISSPMERGPAGGNAFMGRGYRNSDRMMVGRPGCPGRRYCPLVRPAI